MWWHRSRATTDQRRRAWSNTSADMAQAQSQAASQTSTPTQTRACVYTNTLPESHARYVVSRTDLQVFLERHFGTGLDFEIQHQNYRWKFKTPGPLDDVSTVLWKWDGMDGVRLMDVLI